jgi:23S rRNA (uracil1939-C5)-methyltransferase
MGYEHQLALKQRQLRETFERIGKIRAPDIRGIIPSSQIYHYRGKADFQVEPAKAKPPAVGFIDISGTAVIPIGRCEIVDESINQALAGLRQDLAAHKLNLTSDRYTVWSDPNPYPEPESAGRKRPPRCVERFAKGKRFQVPYTGFFQVNASLVDNLVDTVEAMCSLTGNETILDAYCGSGLFSILLASRAKKVYGIDNDGRAIHCARINSRREGLNQATFYLGDTAAIMNSDFVPMGISIDCIILDPPRSGCEKDVLDAVIALRPQKVVYISCNPATQARDLRYLIDRDALLKHLQPLDMFPQTQHIESIALLEIK